MSLSTPSLESLLRTETQKALDEKNAAAKVALEQEVMDLSCQKAGLQHDNIALLELLVQHCVLFNIPESFLRRQIDSKAKGDIVLRALSILTRRAPRAYTECIAVADKLVWLGSINIIAQEAMEQLVEFAITMFLNVHNHQYPSPSRLGVVDANVINNIDDRLMRMVCRHYYKHKTHGDLWDFTFLLDIIAKLANRYLDPHWMLPQRSRRPRQDEFMEKTRQYLRKCRRHRLADLLAYRVCEEKAPNAPNEIIDVIRSFICGDEEVRVANGHGTFTAYGDEVVVDT
ncbi:hypothetical protein LTR37_000367 [Vermiconidia calcicola]|uniref:Uncharacterized protein n=1 Tax=Vermiconidia calcicola TaxID=1690605 RepID=A0ACC3NZ78_9PEZI|nr:hypothetical protein LTR37_000367 [Vermiconidia calcicola]